MLRVGVEMLVSNIGRNSYHILFSPLPFNAILNVVSLAIEYLMHLFAGMAMLSALATGRYLLNKAIVEEQRRGD